MKLFDASRPLCKRVSISRGLPNLDVEILRDFQQVDGGFDVVDVHYLILKVTVLQSFMYTPLAQS